MTFQIKNIAMLTSCPELQNAFYNLQTVHNMTVSDFFTILKQIKSSIGTKNGHVHCLYHDYIATF